MLKKTEKVTFRAFKKLQKVTFGKLDLEGPSFLKATEAYNPKKEAPRLPNGIPQKPKGAGGRGRSP